MDQNLKYILDFAAGKYSYAEFEALFNLHPEIWDRVQELLTQEDKPEIRVNVGSFLNNLNQSLARIQRSGVPAVSERRETEDRIVLTITIPKR